VNNELCLCVFINKSHSGFAIVAVYVDDMNLIETLAELEEIAAHLKSEFEMKDLRKTRLCFDLKFKRCSDSILVYQSNYTPNVLLLSIPLIIHTLYANETLEEVMESKIPYLSSTLRFVVLSSLY
ncbi:hypothetical protein KJ032_26650, partial [Salmonella enterica subsp. enterica serovar Typhimurium]|nr:hypothetical protein [Salmonella enterica subsp. enterica serovar Typhimurium]